MPIFKILDATRISDGRIVVLKRVNRIEYPAEVDITRYLSQFNRDKRNHCVPFLDVLDLRVPFDFSSFLEVAKSFFDDFFFSVLLGSSNLLFRLSYFFRKATPKSLISLA